MKNSLQPKLLPDYSRLIRAQAVDEADLWTWEWRADSDVQESLPATEDDHKTSVS
jgi:hypothetical protein